MKEQIKKLQEEFELFSLKGDIKDVWKSEPKPSWQTSR